MSNNGNNKVEMVEEPIVDEKVEMTDENTVDAEMLEDIEDKPKVELPFYRVTESLLDSQNLLIDIFDLNLEQLIFEKMFILFQRLDVAETNLEDSKVELLLKKEKLMLETDFDEVLGKTKHNKDEREAWMRPHLTKFEDNVDTFKHDIKFYKNKLNILNDLISMKRNLLKVEYALTNAE